MVKGITDICKSVGDSGGDCPLACEIRTLSITFIGIGIVLGVLITLEVLTLMTLF